MLSSVRTTNVLLLAIIALLLAGLFNGTPGRASLYDVAHPDVKSRMSPAGEVIARETLLVHVVNANEFTE